MKIMQGLARYFKQWCSPDRVLRCKGTAMAVRLRIAALWDDKIPEKSVQFVWKEYKVCITLQDTDMGSETSYLEGVANNRKD